MTVQTVIADIHNLLGFVNGEVGKQVNPVQLVTTVAGTFLTTLGEPPIVSFVAVLQAVIDNAANIFPNSSLYKRQAVELLTTTLSLYKNITAAATPAAPAPAAA